MDMLQISNLHKRFGEKEVLKGKYKNLIFTLIGAAIVIVISVFNTSAIRLPETIILGRMIKKPPIRINDVTIWVEYWINAIMSPVKIEEFIASYAPK